MGIIEHRENQERPAESRVQSRYRASVRLSVAPMMDWTDTLQRRGFPGGLVRQWCGHPVEKVRPPGGGLGGA
ncbi:MAG: hypothetical protein LCH59_06400 [Proteobacteria bacterium]|nr:hypothetical protein [Pseudomonadota bacterium]